jgi:hypothetical protein
VGGPGHAKSHSHDFLGMGILSVRALLAFISVLSVVSLPKAVAYPGDLNLESFTDEHPEGKNADAEKKSKANEGPEKTEKAEALIDEKDFNNEPEKPYVPEVDPATLLCRSSKEYIETLRFMRKTKVILVTETTARMIAEMVSKSCDGSAERFAKVLILLRTVGLSDKKALEIALQFSTKSTEVQKNFIEIFNHAFLSEFFDYEYTVAASLAFELSKNYKGNPKNVREDFLDLMRFCKDGAKLDLPTRLCAEYTIRVARLSQHYPAGVRGDFYKLLQRFRSDKQFELELKAALELTYNILKYGPHATANFFQAYDFAMNKQGLDMTHNAAVEFGVRMASRSFKGEEPPIIPEGYRAPRILLHATNK